MHLLVLQELGDHPCGDSFASTTDEDAAHFLVLRGSLEGHDSRARTAGGWTKGELDSGRDALLEHTRPLLDDLTLF